MLEVKGQNLWRQIPHHHYLEQFQLKIRTSEKARSYTQLVYTTISKIRLMVSLVIIRGPCISHSTVTSLWGLAWCHTLICCTFASSCLHLYDAPFASFSICKTHMHVSWITPHTYILYCIAPP